MKFSRALYIDRHLTTNPTLQDAVQKNTYIHPHRMIPSGFSNRLDALLLTIL